MKALAALGLGASMLLGTGLAKAGHTCVSTLDDYTAIDYNYDQARTTFSMKTGWGPNGSTALCGTDQVNCWDYRERCGANWVDLWPGSYDHFHLGFDDPAYAMPFCSCDPHDGKGAGFGIAGRCTLCPNWSALGRFMVPHLGSVWSEIHVRTDFSCTQTFAADCNVPFNFNALNVGGTQAVDVWILDANWHWNIWTNLRAPGNWSWGSFRAREVWVRSANNSATPYRINGYQVTVDS